MFMFLIRNHLIVAHGSKFFINLLLCSNGQLLFEFCQILFEGIVLGCLKIGCNLIQVITHFYHAVGMFRLLLQ